MTELSLFRLKTKTSRLFTWCIRFQHVYWLLFLASIFSYSSPHLIRETEEKTTELSVSLVNGSRMIYTLNDQAFAGKFFLEHKKRIATAVFFLLY